MRSGFLQLSLARFSFDHNGTCYRGTKYSLTRLPIGHALAPYLFQRFAEAVLDEVIKALNIDGIAYLDDWLLHSASSTDLKSAIDMIEAMGITLNYNKSLKMSFAQAFQVPEEINKTEAIALLLLGLQKLGKCGIYRLSFHGPL